jgi:drug/metabolite transporter (DMT)-like permease
MKVIIFSMVAMVCYAASNVILELRFSKYNNLTLMVCYGLVIWLVSLVGRQLTATADPVYNFPVGKDLALLIVMGLIFAAADYFYIGAYTNGGSLMTITCISIMFPVFASAIKFAVTHKTPNMWQIAGYIMAALAVILVTKGTLTKG